MLDVFKTRPHLVEKVWGGRKLGELLGKDLPEAGTWGEAWEVADLPEGQSMAILGEDEVPLGDLVEEYGEALVGTSAPGGRFPLLVKLLDAAADLSVQVHPGPEDLASRPGAHSKDECWLILDADPDGSILHGFQQEVTPEAFRQAVDENRAAELLQRVPVNEGDVFRVPPGTVHAICAGVMLLEIQQPSDTTYRVYDYGRPGLDGNLRPLHLEDALDVCELSPSLPEDRGLERSTGPMLPGARVLCNVDAYRIESLSPDSNTSWAVSDHTAQVVHVLRGSCCLNSVWVEAGETAIVPAAVGRVLLRQPDHCELIVAGLGGPPLLGSCD
jgi:mannose-6-phosphate isomerase